ncbi:MAG: hypothetical protein HOW73_02505 [Polyangiaceae bacterium]|nr:hypothetical protein [Polyangiaceae bacterium]
MKTGPAMQGGEAGKGHQTANIPGVGSPITNEAYNVIAALHAKLEGLEAYRKFALDANPQLWKQFTESDVKCVTALCDELEKLIKDGKFRLREPGRANAPS